MDKTWIEEDIKHFSRHVPFGGASGLEDWVELGIDWSDASFAMVIADVEGGTAKITLSDATAGVQGLSATYDAGYVHPVSGAVVGATIIRPQIDETTFEGLEDWADPPVPLVWFYDLLVTPDGEPQRGYARGSFTINPGAAD